MKLAFAVLLALCASASADATVTLRGGSVWHDTGWPRGTPMLSIAGTQIVAKGDTATASLPASKQLVRATMSIDGKNALAFLVDLRDGHHYTVEGDPCCFLVVGDADDGLAAKARCGTADACPRDTVEIDKFVYRKEECKAVLTCGPAAMFRVRGAHVTIEWDGSEAEEWPASYRGAPVGREHPQHVVARAAGKIVWDDRVVLHHGVRYTLDLTKLDAPRVTIDEAR